MTSKRHVVENIEASEASQFLETISPTSKRWYEGASPKWIFRGHGNAEWHLVPRALRRNGWGPHFKEFDKLGRWPWNADSQAFAEFLILKEFVEEADRGGFQLPEDGFAFRQTWLDHQSEELEPVWKFPSVWPMQVHYPALALAQHYGLPTRLLDWTEYPWTAAYFAAKQAVEQGNSERLAVWAFNCEVAHKQENVEVIRVPTALNPNLAAQGGLHTLVREQHPRGRPASHAGLDEVVNSTFQVPLQKITLPTKEARTVLRLLSQHKVNAATLFPGLAGVVAHMAERCLWDSFSMTQALRPKKGKTPNP